MPTLYEAMIRKRAKWVYDQLQPCVPDDVAAFFGNSYEESRGFENMIENRADPSKGGIGGFQWTDKARREPYERFCAQLGVPVTDADASIQWAVHECLDTEKHAWALTKAEPTLEKKVETFMTKWERPYAPTEHLEIRIKGARIALPIIVEAIKMPGVPEKKPEIPAPVSSALTIEQALTLMLQTQSRMDATLKEIKDGLAAINHNVLNPAGQSGPAPQVLPPDHPDFIHSIATVIAPVIGGLKGVDFPHLLAQILSAYLQARQKGS